MDGGIAAAGRAGAAVLRLVRAACAALAGIPVSAVLLLARLSMGSVFWTSGRTKVEPGTWMTLSDGAVQLFREEYNVVLFTPAFAAFVTMLAELSCPVLLLLGLGSRFAALVLLVVTLVIALFVYPDAYNTHGPWAVCLLLIMIKGPGVVSIDHLVATARGPTLPARADPGQG